MPQVEKRERNFRIWLSGLPASDQDEPQALYGSAGLGSPELLGRRGHFQLLLAPLIRWASCQDCHSRLEDAAKSLQAPMLGSPCWICALFGHIEGLQ
jgi:hypothetical protein